MSFCLIKMQTFRPAALLKRDSNTSVFLWILQNFQNTYFEKHLWMAASTQEEIYYWWFQERPRWFKGATKSYFTHYLFVVYILFNTGLCKSAFSTNSFRKLVFLSFCAFCLFCLLCVEFDVIFINFITFAQSLFI